MDSVEIRCRVPAGRRQTVAECWEEEHDWRADVGHLVRTAIVALIVGVASMKAISYAKERLAAKADANKVEPSKAVPGADMIAPTAKHTSFAFIYCD